MRKRIVALFWFRAANVRIVQMSFPQCLIMATVLKTYKYQELSMYTYLFLTYTYTTHHHTTVLWPFFWDNPGEPVPEENFWTSWCKGRLTEADTSTIRLGATPSGLTSAHLHHPPIFYRPDAPPAAQPTVSKHLLTRICQCSIPKL